MALLHPPLLIPINSSRRSTGTARSVHQGNLIIFSFTRSPHTEKAQCMWQAAREAMVNPTHKPGHQLFADRCFYDCCCYCYYCYYYYYYTKRECMIEVLHMMIQREISKFSFGGPHLMSKETTRPIPFAIMLISEGRGD